MKVDIVIPSYNTLPLLQGLIQQVDETIWARLSAGHLGGHLVVVDNGSKDGSVDFLRELLCDENGYGPYLTVIFNEENLGFAKACNQGTSLGEAEIIVFLNTDVELSDGWLEGVLAAFEDPEVAIAGSQQVKPDGQLSRYTNFISGACLAVRRDWFESVGGFDEQFFFGYDDLDLSYRAVLDGRKYVTTEPAIVHLCRGSHDDHTSAYIEEAGKLFRRKWMEIVLKFVGQQGRFLIGVPSHDLTARELMGLIQRGGWTKQGLVASGLYEEIADVVRAKVQMSKIKVDNVESNLSGIRDDITVAEAYAKVKPRHKRKK